MEGLASASNKFIVAYKRDTPTNLKIVDIYLAYIMLSGIFQFIYMLAAGTFPYNAFLSGFISTVGSFVLAGTWHLSILYQYTDTCIHYSQLAYPNQLPEQGHV